MSKFDPLLTHGGTTCYALSGAPSHGRAPLLILALGALAIGGYMFVAFQTTTSNQPTVSLAIEVARIPVARPRVVASESSRLHTVPPSVKSSRAMISLEPSMVAMSTASSSSEPTIAPVDHEGTVTASAQGLFLVALGTIAIVFRWLWGMSPQLARAEPVTASLVVDVVVTCYRGGSSEGSLKPNDTSEMRMDVDEPYVVHGDGHRPIVFYHYEPKSHFVGLRSATPLLAPPVPLPVNVIPVNGMTWAMASIDDDENTDMLNQVGPTPETSPPWSDIKWLPELDLNAPDTEPMEGEKVMPCFLIEALSYLPDTKRVLNIIEKRYREMYSDILFNGSRVFVVAFLPPDGLFSSSQGKWLAEVGVIFHLDELEDLSAQTDDRVKWRCVHTVTQRVRIKRALNPSCLKDRGTYLRVVVEDLEDEDDDQDCLVEEEAITEAFERIVKLQESCGEVTRFVVDTDKEPLVDMGSSGKDDTTLKMLNEWMAKRAQGLTDFTSDSNIDWDNVKPGDEVPIEWSALPEDFRREVLEMHKFYDDRSSDDLTTLGTGFHKIVQANSHCKRVVILRDMLQREHDKLRAKSTFQSGF